MLNIGWHFNLERPNELEGHKEKIEMLRKEYVK